MASIVAQRRSGPRGSGVWPELRHPERRQCPKTSRVDLVAGLQEIAKGDPSPTLRLPRLNPYSRQGFKARITRKEGLPKVVMETTGGLERLVVEVLHAAGVGSAVINPKRVRDFAKATGLLAKTDRLDAYVLALFGRQIEPWMRPPAEPQRRLLLDLQLRRQQLVRLRSIERNRLKRAEQQACEDSCVRVIDLLGEEIELIESQIASQIQQSEAWQVREKLLRSAPGVGAKTVWSLLAQLPELGSLDGKQIASLAGLAPFCSR